MGFLDFFRNTAETTDLHTTVDLRTRYYKTNLTKVKEQVLEYCEMNKIEVKHVDEVHNEMFLQTKKFHVIVSITQMNPLETAVDIKVQTYTMIGMNAPKANIVKMYRFLDSKLPFKGVSLHT